MDYKWSNPVLLDGGMQQGRGSRRSHLSRILGRFLSKRNPTSSNSSLSTAPTYEPSSLGFILLCALWYTCSALGGTTSKAILNTFRFPVTLTLVQFFFVAFYSFLLMLPEFKLLSAGRKSLSLDVVRKTLPMGAFQVGGHICSSVATSRIPVSTVHTIKALSPLFTVAAYVCLFGVSYSPRTYFSLLPLTLGVMLACTFDVSAASPMGLACAFGSALIFVTQNIYFKHIVPSNPNATASVKLDKLNLLFYSSIFAFILTVPLWLYHDFPVLVRTMNQAGPPVGYLFTNGGVHFAQSILAFLLLSMTSPVTYSIASLLKRVAVIAVALVWARAQLHPAQGFGFSLTCFGLYAYHTAKQDVARGERQKVRAEFAKDAPGLPFNRADTEVTTVSSASEKPAVAISSGRKPSVSYRSPVQEYHSQVNGFSQSNGHAPSPLIHIAAQSRDKIAPYPSPPPSIDLQMS